MIPMVENHVVPFLTERLSGTRQHLVTRVFRLIGIGESAVEERIQDLIRGTNPTRAPLAHTGEVHLRLGAKAPTVDEAEALMAPVEAELRSRIGKHIYGLDKKNLEQAVVEKLIAARKTVAVAESCTGGGLGARLTSVAGSSAAFLGGVISYSNEAKATLLGVDPALIREHGAVSEPVAREMARGTRQRLGADYGISITGVAGPEGGTAEKPVGLVYIGLAKCDGERITENHFIGIREDVRRRSTQVALQILYEELRTSA
jgi:nicotinamide-nucleotide amidase